MPPKDSTPMWEGLGINIQAHNGLLEVLGKFYTDIYLSQQNRPKGMESPEPQMIGALGAALLAAETKGD